MSKRTRISKKLYKSLPADVAEVLRDVVDSYPNIKSLRVVNQPEGWQVWHAEGDSYTYYLNGEIMDLEMVSEATVGAQGVRYEIGAQSPPLPGGTLVFNVWYAGADGYQLTVYSVGDEKFLTAA